MSDNNDAYTESLVSLGLGKDEAHVYLELLQGETTHLRLSRNTGIARTKVYRLMDQLERRGLVQRLTDDRGSFLVAANPENLGIDLTRQEEFIKSRREILNTLVPKLDGLREVPSKSFYIRTYEGERGFRQMCWHELKAKGEVLALGGGTIEELVPNPRWAEKHRALSVEAGYKVRDLVNLGVDQATFTHNQEYLQKQYSCRGISREVIPFDNQTVIYNNTVSIYHHRHAKRVGVEIVSQSYAQMMRSIFELYWSQGIDLPVAKP